MRWISTAVLALVGGLHGQAAAQQSGRVVVGSFAIDQTEVSVGDFKAFAKKARVVTTAELVGFGHEYDGRWVRRSGWSHLAPQGQPAGDREPAVHVTWSEARDYCASAGGRLPSFAEWRRAAYSESRAQPTDGFERGRTYAYPVGDRPEGMNTGRRAHMQVGSTRRGVNGLFDMGGNVWEWVADRQGEEALTAGGSWWYGPEQTKADAAQWKAATFFAVYIGFRCVYDVR